MTKKVHYRTSGQNGRITVVGYTNASGQAIPPMIIYDAARLNPAWTNGEVPGTKYGLSSNGWINSDLFEAWFAEHFLENAISACLLFLLLDGHSTHHQPHVILWFALEHNCVPGELDVLEDAELEGMSTATGVNGVTAENCSESDKAHPGEARGEVIFTCYSTHALASVDPHLLLRSHQQRASLPLSCIPPPSCIPRSAFSTSLNKSSMNTENNIGDRLHPCAILLQTKHS